MIAWQNPSAFIALVALAGPIVIHLLRHRRAARVLFPTDRFVRASPTGAVRLRAPGDTRLLALRLAIVALAVGAVAQPVVLTPGRLPAWDSAVARAVIVDVSDSMAPQARDAAAAAESEMRRAATALRIDAADLGDGLRRATAALSHTPPARREVVVVSDFQRGSLAPPALAAVPGSFGVRFVRVGGAVNRRTVDGTLLLGTGGTAHRPHVVVEGGSTTVTWERVPSTSPGLTVDEAAGDHPRLVDAVAASGAPAPSPEQPVVLKFDGVDADAAEPALQRRWMLETMLRLRKDPELARIDDPTPAIRARSDGDALIVAVQAVSDSYPAAAALRGLLTARHGGAAQEYAEYEVGAIDDVQLSGWSRPAGPVETEMWRHADRNDARWFWGLVLGLLAIETVVRSRTRS